MTSKRFGPFFAYLNGKYGLDKLAHYLPDNRYLNVRYFTGLHPESGKIVFIKTDGASGETSEREACAIELLKLSSSRYFPRLFAHETAGKYPFVAIEFLNGVTLEHLLLYESAVIDRHKENLLEQMADILAILHERGIIHRDIRPSNLMVLPDVNGQLSSLVLVDFAFAIIAGPDGGAEELRYLQEREYLRIDLGGSSFKPAPLIWDDAFAFCKIAQLIDPCCALHFPEAWAKLYGSVNRVTYSSPFA
ncbi:protein kinase domain-containing protein [Paenibacillus contaminans]|nr:hypothetical protein [Paenibacillus contaminans]